MPTLKSTIISEERVTAEPKTAVPKRAITIVIFGSTPRAVNMPTRIIRVIKEQAETGVDLISPIVFTAIAEMKSVTITNTIESANDGSAG